MVICPVDLKCVHQDIQKAFEKCRSLSSSPELTLRYALKTKTQKVSQVTVRHLASTEIIMLLEKGPESKYFRLWSYMRYLLHILLYIL